MNFAAMKKSGSKYSEKKKGYEKKHNKKEKKREYGPNINRTLFQEEKVEIKGYGWYDCRNLFDNKKEKHKEYEKNYYKKLKTK